MSEKSESQLTDEFKKDIKEKRKQNNFLGTLLAFLAIVLVFGTLGVAGYQMLFRPENIDSKSAAEKIESRPEEKTEVKTETPVVTAPAATTPAPTPATPAATAETTYTVVAGDTWSSIANAHGITSAKLMEFNGTTSEDLQIGQTIKIPKG